jgi:hypothetical protein
MIQYDMMLVECSSCYTFRGTAYRLPPSCPGVQSSLYTKVYFYIYVLLFFHLHRTFLNIT